MSLAKVLELGASNIKAHKAVYKRLSLEELGHFQLNATIVTDNTTTNVIINKIHSKHMKVIVMWFHWLQDQAVQEQLEFLWKQGKANCADHETSLTIPLP